MIYRVLGGTGLRVSVIGVGTGGLDPLGETTNRSEDDMVTFLRRAFELGINVFDTSPGYGMDGRSERILGKALKYLPREEIVVSTKVPLVDGSADNPSIADPAAVIASIEASLSRLGVDAIDVLLVAVPGPQFFHPVMDDLVPVLNRLKEQGKVRFLGSSEQTRSDGSHEWLQKALPSGAFDVAMVGYNMINQSAKRFVFPLCKAHNIGSMNVFTIRNIFGNVPRLKEVISDLKCRQLIDDDAESDANPLGWLVDGQVNSLVEAGYRFAAYSEGVTTVMCGCIDAKRLEENCHSIQKGPLPSDQLARLDRTFSRIAEPIGN